MKIVQAGLDGFGRSWAELVLGALGAELVAVADPAPAGRSWARTNLNFPAERCSASFAEALAGCACDAAVIVTPPATHREVATEALRAGKHVLIEKPLATTLADAQALVEIAAHGDRVLLVSQDYRFRPTARAARQFVTGGALGALTQVAVRFRRDTRRL